MRATIAEDGNNVDKIGSASNPGLRANTLTRAQHRARLQPKYRGKIVDTPADLEKLLDSLYGPEPVE